ncbi:Metallo-dependent hydrolase [Trematosphaeria pertusa]|uniref:Metallo-dependent hydrolase n=1 Tax=Trematosphaeria pertusa TaxID=390896 RepID=A0A6A6IPC4_9PLEO|nr:Metallo-dependent hydrolase [Trematosphaeria pertusa]KAF2252321.1 Metallo-dependent hydrolase [Trematosphaeria pertusa]
MPADAASVDIDYARRLPKVEVSCSPSSLLQLFARQPPRAHGLQSLPRTALLIRTHPQLHAHLTGSISRSCLHHIWERKTAEDPALHLADPLVAIPPEKVDYDIKTFFPLFSSYIYRLCNDLPSIEFSTKAVLCDFQTDGVAYLELRTTPRAIPEQNVSKDDYVRTIAELLMAHNEGEENTMRAFLILSVDRRNTAAEAEEVVDLALKHRSAGVVGVDLCGNPAKGDVRVFTNAFGRAKAAGLKITLHFAETEASATDQELETLLSWAPDRLGHVIHVKNKFRERIERECIGVELCLSCNVHAKLITGTFSDHHFGEWRHSHVPLALCTDDVGVFCSPLSQEYYLAATHFDLDRSQLKSLAERAIDSIFSGLDERSRLKTLFSNWSG